MILLATRLAGPLCPQHVQVSKPAAKGWIFCESLVALAVADLEREKNPMTIKNLYSFHPCVHSCNVFGCIFQKQRRSAMAVFMSISTSITAAGLELLKMNPGKHR